MCSSKSRTACLFVFMENEEVRARKKASGECTASPFSAPSEPYEKEEYNIS